MKIDMSRRTVTVRLRQVAQLRRACLALAKSSKGVAVLLGANEFEAMQEKIELLSDVQTSLNQLAKGEGISHQEAKEKLVITDLGELDINRNCYERKWLWAETRATTTY